MKRLAELSFVYLVIIIRGSLCKAHCGQKFVFTAFEEWILFLPKMWNKWNENYTVR